MLSVLTTTYNREDYVAEAIESVLASTYTDFEYIVVDDCSKDNTVEIIKSYQKLDSRIRFYQNEKNLGDYANRNKAASYATREYIKYLDSDDLLYPHGLQVMVWSMNKYPDAGFGLSSKRDDTTPFPLCASPRQAYLEHFGGHGHFFRAPGSAIIRRSAFNSVGGFSGKRFVGDIELWFTLAQKYPMVKFPGELYFSRLHEASEKKYEETENPDAVRIKLIKQFLQSPDCPVDPKEIEQTFPQLMKQKLKQLLQRN